MIKYKQKDESASPEAKSPEAEEKPPRYTKQQKEYLLALLGTSKLRNENSAEEANQNETDTSNLDRTYSSSSAQRQYRRSHSSNSKRSNSSATGIYLYKPERGRAYIVDNSWSPNISRN